MSDVAIRVDHIGKRYRIGGKRSGYKTLRESLVIAAGAPIRWLREGGHREENTFWALDDISFEVKRGEAVGIIGRNGAGKSTLLKVLSRITKPTRGRVELYGRVGSLLEVGTGFHPELTGRENIYLNGAILGMSRREIERKFDEIVDFAEVEKFLETPVKFYSSGMYVRLAFAVASSLEPEILVVDEVLAVGDMAFQKKSLGKMGDVATSGRTVLFVSHNMGAINQFCQRTVLLSGGKLIGFGATEKIVSEYLTSDNDDKMDVELDPARRPNSAYVTTHAKIVKKDGGSYGQISVIDEFQIVLEVLVRRIVDNTEIGIRITNQSGVVVCTSGIAAFPELQKHIKPGLNRLVLHIPSNFLSPGIYTVTIILHLPMIELFDRLEDVLVFEISETGSNMWLFRGRNYGVVLVNFPWSIDTI